MTATIPKLQLRKLSDLKPDPNNARTHSAEQVAQVAESIRVFGWTNPILADDLIRAGHGRHMAATLLTEAGEAIYLAPGKEAGGAKLPKGQVPVIDCSGWGEAQRRAYTLADNQLALNAGWDDKILQAEIEALAGLNFDIAVIGFDTRAIDAILNGAKAQDPDAEVEPPADPVSRPGDIWILGNHRIACGSSTDPATVTAVLAGAKPILMVTDPPYGVNYDASWREGAGINRKGAAIGKVLNDDNADWREAWALFPGDVVYVWHAALFAGVVADSLISCGFGLRSQIIWAKSQMVMSRGDYHWQHEPCWYAVRNGKPGHYDGGRKQTTVWNIDKPHASETGHSTQKPVECMKRPIENNSKRGDTVYEPFSGSGTSIIACEMTGRRCLAIELNPAYVDVAALRWAEFANGVPVLEATGQSYAEVQAVRAAEPEPVEV